MRQRNILAILAVCAGSAFCQTPVVADKGVANAASFDNSGVAPGSLVSIFGSELADGIQVGDTVPLSNTISNVSVTFNGIPAGLDFVSTSQINAEVPWNVLPDGVNSGTATMVVTRHGVPSSPTVANVAAVNPGVFSIPNGAGNAVAINNADGSLAAPAGSIPGIATHPALIGDALIIYATGLGAVDAPIDNGAASPDKLRRTLVVPTVLVGGKEATVLFSGLTPQFPGVYQVNIQVPPGAPPGNAIPLQLEIGSILTTDKVTIALQ